jgi:hypothetical protein
MLALSVPECSPADGINAALLDGASALPAGSSGQTYTTFPCTRKGSDGTGVGWETGGEMGAEAFCNARVWNWPTAAVRGSAG